MALYIGSRLQDQPSTRITRPFPQTHAQAPTESRHQAIILAPASIPYCFVSFSSHTSVI
jgi:hypothetical protein